MNVHTYTTAGGKDVIYSYIDELPKKERAEALEIINILEREGLNGLKHLDTRQLQKKLWEIKFYYHNRIFYVIADEDNIYLLHACRKQKDKSEKFELEKAVKRAKELE